MSGTPGIRDDNYKPVLLGVDSTDPTKTVPIKIDPTTGGIMCE